MSCFCLCLHTESITNQPYILTLLLQLQNKTKSHPSVQLCGQFWWINWGFEIKVDPDRIHITREHYGQVGKTGELTGVFFNSTHSRRWVMWGNRDNVNNDVMKWDRWRIWCYHTPGASKGRRAQREVLHILSFKAGLCATETFLSDPQCFLIVILIPASTSFPRVLTFPFFQLAILCVRVCVTGMGTIRLKALAYGETDTVEMKMIHKKCCLHTVKYK